MEELTIAVIEGTTRTDRLSIHAANLVTEIGKKIPGINIVFVDPLQLHIPETDGDGPASKIPFWSELSAKADAYFIVTPEYNHSYPGTLKRLIDSEDQNYAYKPIAFAGVSNGPWGGTRAIEALLPVVRTLKMVAIATDVHFPKVQELFDANGMLIDQAFIERVERVYSELIKMARIMKQGRTSFATPS